MSCQAHVHMSAIFYWISIVRVLAFKYLVYHHVHIALYLYYVSIFVLTALNHQLSFDDCDN